nr:DNA/RNA non-specific endonuclease [Lachnobacterium bovis]
MNDNKPFFDDKLLTKKSFEYYSDLDSLGRCGFAVASIGQDLMPTQKRGAIGMVKPTGWHTIKYDHVDGKYLYNRCHLIGYQLTAENANKQNLITGTRYLNVEGMLPFENLVADYVKETNNHVLYRVTPIFKGNDLVAKGVLIEGKSVEDKGEGVTFNVFCYNTQPKVSIDYKTGYSHLK